MAQDRHSKLFGVYQPSSSILSTAMDKSRTHVLAGHKSFFRLFKISRMSGQCMFQEMCPPTPCQNLKQISWNQVFEQKIAVATDKQVMIYDMEHQSGIEGQFEKCTFTARDPVGSINHIQWNNNHPNVMLVSEGNLLRVWDLRQGRLGKCTSVQVLNTVDFDSVMPNFKINCDNTLIGSVTYDGVIKLYDLKKIGHEQFDTVFINVPSNGSSLFQFDPIHKNMFYDCGLGLLNCWELAGERPTLKVSLNSITSVTHLDRSIDDPNLLFVVGPGAQKSNTEVHCFNIKHKYRPERLYHVPNLNKVLNFMIAQEPGLLILHQKEKLLGVNIDYFSNLYGSAPCSPVLFDQERHQLIYNLEVPSDIVKRLDKRFSKPILYANQPEITLPSGMSLKQELEFIHSKYKIMGNINDISLSNVKVARILNKKLCEDMWGNLSMMLPSTNPSELFSQHDWGSEEEERVDINLEQILQQVVDQGELPTVVYYIIVVNRFSPRTLSVGFKKRVFADYIQVLRKFQLYHIAARICMDSQTPQITQTTQESTTVLIMCTRCNKKIASESNCCQTPGCTKMICVLCKETLDGLNLWCQGCSHSFHIDHAIEYFSVSDECPYGCGHKCYKIIQQDILKMETMKKRVVYLNTHPLLPSEG